MLGAIGIAQAHHVPSTDTADWFHGTWIQPAESTIPNNAEGDMIRYGKLLLTETPKYMGPLSDRPFVGSKHSCSNCHMDAGATAWGAPWAVVYIKYGNGVPGVGPYAERSDRNLDVENRVNDCMMRSVNGIELPRDSHEMLSIKAFFKWMSTGMQVSDFNQVVGQGTPVVPDLTRAADPVRGKVVYEENCAVCHGDTGAGVFDEERGVYIYPSVWGPDAFNDGAGMARIRTAVQFVRANMPFGWANATDSTHQLSREDAWDATAYVLSNSRPSFSGHLTDWSGFRPSDCRPNWLAKRVDGPYEWLYPRIKPDGTRTSDTTYPAEWPFDQHVYGPFQPLLAEQADLQADYAAITPRPVYPNCLQFEFPP
jgi:thiosulfate dehydrogenase